MRYTGSMNETMSLIRAAERGDLSGVVCLAEKTRHSPNGIGQGLTRAARNGHTMVVEVLLSYCDNDYDRNMALMEAAEHGRADCVRLLLANKVDATALNSSALQAALKRRQVECIALLAPVSDQEAVVVAMLQRFQDAVDDLAPHMSVELLRQAWRAAPVGMKLPRMQATLEAFEAAEILESTTPAVSVSTPGPRL